MGVNTTGAIFKGFEYDGENSKDYGVYLTGEAVYNAPERDVEVITIPGRNGAFIRDNGRFENITVTYPAGIFGSTQADFAEGVSAFRNFLASRKGYCRLSDEYNPDEYREAVYKSGLDVSPEAMGRAGQFNIVFECKPQRFLNSGMFPQQMSVTGGIDNPTLFDAHPLLHFRNTDGNDGAIYLGSQEISILSAILGVIPLELDAVRGTSSTAFYSEALYILNSSSYNAGDAITLEGAELTFNITGPIMSITSSNENGLSLTSFIYSGSYSASIKLKSEAFTFNAGTNATNSKSIDITITAPGNFSETKTLTLNYAYLAGDQHINVIWQKQTFTNYSIRNAKSTANYSATVDSSVNALDNVDIYIDLDTGEAYSIDGQNNAVSLNNFVNLGGELPTLPPGYTEVSFSGNINPLYITPRWWKV